MSSIPSTSRRRAGCGIWIWARWATARRALGTRVYEPYLFALGDVLRKGTNHLEIRVTNTLANAILAKGVWEKWKKELPYEWPYEVMQRDYEKESVPSGLFGPVTIL